MFVFSTGVKVKPRVFYRDANAAVYGGTFLKTHPQWTRRPAPDCLHLKTSLLHPQS